MIFFQRIVGESFLWVRNKSLMRRMRKRESKPCHSLERLSRGAVRFSWSISTLPDDCDYHNFYLISSETKEKVSYNCKICSLRNHQSASSKKKKTKYFGHHKSSMSHSNDSTLGELQLCEKLPSKETLE